MKKLLLIALFLMFKITFTLIPSAILLYSPLLEGKLWWSFAAIHLIMCIIIFLGPYTLMLHNTSHRPFFKKKFNIWNKYIPWFLGIFMGQSPDLYFYHHMIQILKLMKPKSSQTIKLILVMMLS